MNKILVGINEGWWKDRCAENEVKNALSRLNVGGDYDLSDGVIFTDDRGVSRTIAAFEWKEYCPAKLAPNQVVEKSNNLVENSTAELCKKLDVNEDGYTFVVPNEVKQATPTMRLSNDSDERKNTPIFSGVLNYFPLAIAAVAQLSKKGNDKHNPGEPLHWAKGKSIDHKDCISRHLIDAGTIDPDSEMFHDVGLAWRALANLETLLESQNESISN